MTRPVPLLTFIFSATCLLAFFAQAQAEGAGESFELAPSRGDGSADTFSDPAPAKGTTGERVGGKINTWTETPKNVFYIRAVFPNLPAESVSQEKLLSILSGPVAASISEMSYGKTTITAAVSSTAVMMPQNSSYYRTGDKNAALHADAMTAYRQIAGETALDGFDIIGVHFDAIGMRSDNVIYTGLATIGGSRQWMQNSLKPTEFIHQFGHNYGLQHASAWKTTDGSVIGTGVHEEYGDTFDVMGSGHLAQHHFGVYGKQAINWISPTQVTRLSAPAHSGIHRLYRFDHPAATGLCRALQVSRVPTTESYWLGFRPGVADNPWLQNGVSLTWVKSGVSNPLLLDTTPGSFPGKADSAIAIGRTYSDPGGEVHITPIAKGGSGADQWLDVNVQIGLSGNLIQAVTLNAPASGSARVPITISAQATDPYGDALSYFWDFGDGTPSVNSASAQHAWMVGGTYTVKVTASNMKGGTASAQATITIADPLTTWTSIPNPADIKALTYLEGRYLAITTTGFHFSVDRQTWSHQRHLLDALESVIAYDGEMFVAVINTDEGTFPFSSADGKTWKAAAPIAGPISSLKPKDGGLIAFGPANRMIGTHDHGQTWQAMPLPSSPAVLPSVVWGNGIFVAASTSATTTTILTSTDGVQWTEHVNPITEPAGGNIGYLTFVDGFFYLGGYRVGIHRSADGVTWEPMIIHGRADFVYQVTKGPGFLVAAGAAETQSILLVSLDGKSWYIGGLPHYFDPFFADGKFVSGNFSTASFDTDNRAPVATITGPSECVARTNSTFRANASDADGDPLTLIWDFGDGTMLEEAANCHHSFRAGGTYQVKFHAIDRRGGITTATKTVTVSDPLAVWMPLASGITDPLDHFTTIAASGDRIIALGAPGGIYRASTDGITWSGGKLGGQLAFERVIHDGNQFVACGSDINGTSKGTIHTSPDGLSWTRRYFSGESLRDIAFGMGLYVAVGGPGSALISQDAISWTPVSTGSTAYLGTIAYGDGQFVAGGMNAAGTEKILMTSPDGISWSDTTFGIQRQGGTTIDRVCYSYDRFFAVGRSTELLHSVDRGATFTSAGLREWNVADFCYGSGLHFACGAPRDNTLSSINLLSLDGTDWIPLPTPAPNQPPRKRATHFQGRFYTAGMNGAIWRSEIVTPPFSSGFAAWQASLFPGAEPLSGPDDDFDGDGMSNLAEYATGTDPRNAADRITLAGVVDDDRFIVSLPKAAGTTGVSQAFEYSSDLTDWTTEGVTLVEDTPARQVVSIPLNSAKGFLRPVFSLQ